MAGVPHTFANQSGPVPAQELDDNFAALLPNGPWPAGTVLGNAGGSPANAAPMTPSQLYTLLKPIMPWEVAPYMGGIQGGPSWNIFRYQPSTNILIVQASCYASAGSAATGSTTFNLLDNGVVLGTVTFNAGGTVGSVSITGTPYMLLAGHVLAIQGPATADGTLADMNITLGGQRA